MEIFAGAVLTLWVLGFVLFVIGFVLAGRSGELPAPVTPISLLIVVMALFAWPVTIPMIYKRVKEIL